MSNSLPPAFPASVLAAVSNAGSQPVIELRQLAIHRPNYRTDKLSEAQQVAILHLVQGKSIAEAARQAQVHRATVHRWIHSDPNFQAAYNAWQDEMSTSCYARLLTLCDEAVDTVQAALKKRHTRTAITLLRGMGMLRPRKDGPTNADDIEKTMQLADRQRRLELEKTEQNLSESEELVSVQQMLSSRRPSMAKSADK